MMNEMKKVCKLIKYGYNFKMNMGFAILFTIFGVIFSVLGSMMSSENHMQPAVLSTLYMLLGPIMVIQLLYTLLFCDIVKSSPKNYTLEVTAPNFFAAVIGILAYIFSIISAAIGIKVSPELAESYNTVIISSGLLIAVCLLYFGVCYKYFVLGTIGFMVGFIVVYGGVSAAVFKINDSFPIATGNSIFIGAVIVAVGILTSSIIRKLLYKKPISKLSAGAYLRKALQ